MSGMQPSILFLCGLVVGVWPRLSAPPPAAARGGYAVGALCRAKSVTHRNGLLPPLRRMGGARAGGRGGTHPRQQPNERALGRRQAARLPPTRAGARGWAPGLPPRGGPARPSDSLGCQPARARWQVGAAWRTLLAKTRCAVKGDHCPLVPTRRAAGKGVWVTKKAGPAPDSPARWSLAADTAVSRQVGGSGLGEPRHSPQPAPRANEPPPPDTALLAPAFLAPCAPPPARHHDLRHDVAGPPRDDRSDFGVAAAIRGTPQAARPACCSLRRVARACWRGGGGRAVRREVSACRRR